ncbi:MAG: Gx transporter family protein [Spirochaetia bacterium]|nr:Gx transporter family protein [Spirochaetia bacterium]
MMSHSDISKTNLEDNNKKESISSAMSGKAVPETHAKFRLETIALLGALALFLSTVEYMVPKPVPFMRLGLANLAVMIGLSFLNNREYLLLIVLKVVGQGLVHGTVFSYIFLFSLAGSTASGIVMLLLFRLVNRHVSFVGISIAGGISSNLIQILLARLILFGESAWLIAPPFLILGFFSSLFLGILVQRFYKQSEWISRHISQVNDKKSQVYDPQVYDPEKLKTGKSAFSFRSKKNLPMLFGLTMIPAIVFTDLVWLLFVQVLFLLTLHKIQGRKIKMLPNIIMIISITALNLLQVNGKVLWLLADFPITEGALIIGLRKAFLLIELIYLSQYMVSRNPVFPGKAGALLSLQFSYFNRLMKKRFSLHPGRFMKDIDKIINTMEEEQLELAKTEAENSGAAEDFSISLEKGKGKRKENGKGEVTPIENTPIHGFGLVREGSVAILFWLLTIGLTFLMNETSVLIPFTFFS